LAAIGEQKISGTRITIRSKCAWKGAYLDQHGYLVDIVDIETNLEAMVGYFGTKR